MIRSIKILPNSGDSRGMLLEAVLPFLKRLPLVQMFWSRLLSGCVALIVPLHGIYLSQDLIIRPFLVGIHHIYDA